MTTSCKTTDVIDLSRDFAGRISRQCNNASIKFNETTQAMAICNPTNATALERQTARLVQACKVIATKGECYGLIRLVRQFDASAD